MANKEFYIADSSETTYYLVPGSTADFSVESESADDTIFGQTYSSEERTLLTWTASSDAVVKGYAGYTTTIKKQGTSTSTTGEAFSQDSGQVYQVDDATKQIIDRNNTITVYDGTTDVTDQVESIDALFGKITFLDSYTVSGEITADYNYFPTSALGKANSVSLTQSADTIDTSDFATVQGNSGYRTFDPGLRTYEVSLDGIFDATTDLRSEVLNRNELIIEIDLAGNGSDVCRLFAKASSQSQSGDVGALEDESVTFTATVPYSASDGVDNISTPINWSFSGSSIVGNAIQTAINAWLNEEKPYCKYLHDPSAAAGSQGYKGQAVLTDVSVDVGIDSMNTLSLSFQGDGSPTDV